MGARDEKHFTLTAGELVALVRASAERTRALVSDLSDEELRVPRSEILNPFDWELGHVAYFWEANVLRFGQEKHAEREELYNSFEVDHGVRWELALPDRAATEAYARETTERVCAALEGKEPDPWTTYLHLLALQHEDMHVEAFCMMRQVLGYPAPPLVRAAEARERVTGSAPSGEVECAGGRVTIGQPREAPFVYDNEKWVHEVEVEPFAIARCPVTASEFVEFVEDGGYERRELWSNAGWRWREGTGRDHPVYWRRDAGGAWERREFDRWVPLELGLPALNLSWYECEAWCAWAGRRLPTEAEWECAARSARGDALARHAWECEGDAAYRSEAELVARANVGASRGGCVGVGALASGDSALGCRQMLGNVWEWTSTPFYPYPGFVVDEPYREYSAPWFGDRKVLKGGSWATPARLAYVGFRNFFTPDRCDVFAGFRTCSK